MTAKKSGWCTAALFLGAIWMTGDYINPPEPYQNVDPAVCRYLDTTPKQPPIGPVIGIWVLAVLCFFGTGYLGYCEEEEAKEASRGLPAPPDAPAATSAPIPLESK